METVSLTDPYKVYVFTEKVNNKVTIIAQTTCLLEEDRLTKLMTDRTALDLTPFEYNLNTSSRMLDLHFNTNVDNTDTTLNQLYRFLNLLFTEQATLLKNMVAKGSLNGNDVQHHKLEFITSLSKKYFKDGNNSPEVFFYNNLIHKFKTFKPVENSAFIEVDDVEDLKTICLRVLDEDNMLKQFDLSVFVEENLYEANKLVLNEIHRRQKNVVFSS